MLTTVRGLAQENISLNIWVGTCKTSWERYFQHTSYFTVELAIKVVAQGFVLGPKTYLADLANWLDVFIVGAGIFDFMPTDAEGGGGVSSLRALRVLRALRAVNKFPNLKARSY